MENNIDNAEVVGEIKSSKVLSSFITPPPKVSGPNKDGGYTIKLELAETDASEAAKLLLVDMGTTLKWTVELE